MTTTTPTRTSKMDIGFALVNVHISLKPLINPKKAVSGKYTCTEHGPGLKQQYVCGIGEPHEHVVEGKVISYPHPDDPSQYVVIDPSVLDEFAEERTGVAKIETTVPVDSIDPAYFASTLLVWPGDGDNAERGFDLIATYLRDEGKAALCTTVVSKRTRLMLFRWSHELGCVLAHVLQFESEIRHNDVGLVRNGQEVRGAVDPKEYKAAKQLLDGLDGEFDPKEVTDTYTALMQSAIRQAADGVVFEKPKVEAEPSAGDLMAALTASIEASSGAKPKAPAKRTRKTTAKTKA